MVVRSVLPVKSCLIAPALCGSIYFDLVRWGRCGMGYSILSKPNFSFYSFSKLLTSNQWLSSTSVVILQQKEVTGVNFFAKKFHKKTLICFLFERLFDCLSTLEPGLYRLDLAFSLSLNHVFSVLLVNTL